MRSPRQDSGIAIEPEPSERSVIAYLVFLSVLMAIAIDTSLPAFDEIADHFGRSADDTSISLVVTVFLLGSAAGQLVFGPLSDRFGRAPALRAGLVLYAIGAVGSTLAPSFGFLLVSRTIWGLGAAAPSGLRPAIARDLYGGDRMARVMSVVMSVFILAPAVAPLLGEGLLVIGGWRTVMGAPGLLVIVALIWSARFAETLPAERRRPFQIRPIMAAVREVMTTRASLGYALSMTFTFGAFFSFLGSSQPIVDKVFGRSGQFALFFGISALVMGLSLLASSRLVHRYGAHRVLVTALLTMVGAAAVQLVLALASDGKPNVWLWLATVSIMNAGSVPSSPMGMALVMEPMQHIAGTAASAVGAMTLAGSALLGSLIDRQITTSVTPMPVGFLVYGTLSLGFAWWARGASRNESEAPLDAVAPSP